MNCKDVTDTVTETYIKMNVSVDSLYGEVYSKANCLQNFQWRLRTVMSKNSSTGAQCLNIFIQKKTNTHSDIWSLNVTADITLLSSQTYITRSYKFSHTFVE